MYMPWCHKQHVTIILTHHYYGSFIPRFLISVLHRYIQYILLWYNELMHFVLAVWHVLLCVLLCILPCREHLYYISKRISGLRFASPMTSKCATCHQQYFIKMQIFWRVLWLVVLHKIGVEEYCIHTEIRFFFS